MFNITGGEIIIVLILALVVLGPDKLPEFVRRAGRLYGEVKRMSTGFRTEFRDAIDEPVREMQDTMNVARSWFDEGIAEVKDVGDDLRSAVEFRTDGLTDNDDDPNFYDDDGRMITAMPASGPAHDAPAPVDAQTDDGVSAEVPGDTADAGSEANTPDPPSTARRPVQGPSPDGSVDAFGGLTPRPGSDGPAQ